MLHRGPHAPPSTRPVLRRIALPLMLRFAPSRRLASRCVLGGSRGTIHRRSRTMCGRIAVRAGSLCSLHHVVSRAYRIERVFLEFSPLAWSPLAWSDYIRTGSHCSLPCVVSWAHCIERYPGAPTTVVVGLLFTRDRIFLRSSGAAVFSSICLETSCGITPKRLSMDRP